MKILPQLRILQSKGFNLDVLIGMSYSALCLQRLKNGIETPPVDPGTLSANFFGEDEDVIQMFFQVHNEIANNAFNVLASSDVFLRKRTQQIDADERYGALPCDASVLREDLVLHKKFLIDGANAIADQIPQSRKWEFDLLTADISWADVTMMTDASSPTEPPPAPTA